VNSLRARPGAGHLAVIGFIGLFLAACTSAAPSASPSAAAQASPGTPEPTTAEPVEIRLWSPHGPNFDNVAKTAITDYQSAHPNVTIKIEPVDNPSYLQRVLTAAAAGTMPDIIYANPGIVASMIESGTVFGDMPVDMFKDELANTVPAFSKLQQDASGKQYLLPIFGGYHGWDYQPKALADAGFSQFPATWSQFLDACTKLTIREGDKVTREGISWRFRTYGPRVEFMGLLGTQGVQMIDASGKVNINTPEGIKVLKLMHDTVYTQKCSVPLSVKGVPEPGVLGIATNTAAIEFQFPGSGNFVIGQLKDKPQLADNWNKTPLWPKPDEGGKDYVLVSGDGFGVSKTSAHPEVAWDFLKFLSQKQYMLKLAEFATVARSDVMSDPAVIQFYSQLKSAPNVLDLFTKPEISAAAVPDLTGAAIPGIEKAMGDVITRLFEDPNADPAAYAAEMQTAVEAALAEQKK
jgi:ABC-type glycerol-3-phosphate transport system substrate-binding protein